MAEDSTINTGFDYSTINAGAGKFTILTYVFLKVSPVHRVNLQSQWQRNILICVKSNTLRQELAA